MKVDISEYGRYNTSLRCTGLRRVPTLTLKISSFQELCNQFQKSVVLNATLQNQNELLVTYVVEASLDITLNDPIDTYFRTVDDVLDCRLARPMRTESM